ncbi:hypothetical protein HK405_008685 [Cladochytrium tenue]|nr:hypothetical protein HK405_008685 [Cladochytrium tenue]
MKDNVLSLRVVLADGTVIKTRRRAVKSSAGYDLTRLFIGSEGTLGVVTEATLRLRRLPTHTSVVLAQFPTLRAAAAAVHRLVLSGVPFQRLELMDALAVRAVNLHDLRPGESSPFSDRASLLAECAALSPRGLLEQRAVFDAVCKEHGAAALHHSENREEEDRIWNLRKKCYFSVPALRTHPSVLPTPDAAPPKVGVLVTDVAVPVSRLADAMEATERLLAAEGLIGPMLIHAGDGNIHCLVVLRDGDAAELDAAERLREQLAVLALSMDGTITGEHGVGMGKRLLLEKEADGPTLELMKTLKLSLDPNNILNPGKILVPGAPAPAPTAPAAVDGQGPVGLRKQPPARGPVGGEQELASGGSPNSPKFDSFSSSAGVPRLEADVDSDVDGRGEVRDDEDIDDDDEEDGEVDEAEEEEEEEVVDLPEMQLLALLDEQEDSLVPAFSVLTTEAAVALHTRGWAVLDALLPPAIAAEAAAAALELGAVEADPPVFRPAAELRGLEDDPFRDRAARDDCVAWLHPDQPPASTHPALSAAVARLAALRDDLALLLHLAGQTEFQLALYRGNGGRYERHRDAFPIDDPTDTQQRRVTCVLYLTEHQVDGGGGLRIFRPLGAPPTDVATPPGRAVLFLSGVVDHEVLPVFTNRVAMTAWMR